jgi:CheY-like chemotaxis protein
MTRVDGKSAALYLYSAIAVVLAGTFVGDLYMPLGLTIWIVYLIPLLFSFVAWRPKVPLIVCVAVTVLLAIGYLTSPSGIAPRMAMINRIFGGVTAWVIACAGHEFIRNKVLVRQHAWFQSGQMGLSSRMQGDQRIDELGDNILGYLAEYLDAHAGAMYVADDDGLRRLAAYALPAAGAPERVAQGEGLLGQAVKDGRAFVVKDVPEGYLAIGSALGRAAPRHLLVAPAKVSGEVNAILEFGLLHSDYKSYAQFLERTSESIAVAIRSAKYRARLQELLEETRRQAEKLQLQTEELRVTNEELEEQGRALRQSQAQLEQQQEELEQTNTQLEEQAQRLELQRDELQRAKATLEGQTYELEQASRYKSDFLANMSHELRTPLNSSLILAKLLADNLQGNLTAEQVQYAQTILSSGNSLLSLISDILDLSKIESGRMDVRPESVQLSQLIESLGRIFRPVAAAKELELRTVVASDSPATIYTDPQRLEQVLQNLLSNAFKFTQAGQVELSVARVPGGRLAFAVRDTGIGVSPEQQRVIFEAFRQADGSTSRRFGGTGLGLSIARELARLLGGEIQVQSELAGGSTFTLTLPEAYHPDLVRQRKSVQVGGEAQACAVAAYESPAPGPPLAALPPRPRAIADDREHLIGGRVILVVEDDESFARILYDLAHELDFQCLIATTAEEGLTAAAQYLPSAVVLDVGLPDGTGLCVLDRLKQDARTRHIPVHVVSASDYMEAAYSLGAVGYMLKPVKREELIQAFKELEDRFARRMRRVLIIEDDPAQLESLRKLLGSREVETVAAMSAAECLEQLKTATFDCMVLDLSLPDASGFSLLETLSREDAYSFPPVIVYTGRDLSPDEEQRLRRYSKSIIIKGAKSPERLLDELTLFLHQVVSELPPEQQRLLQKARSRDAALESRRILVVEDDVRSVFALTSILEPRGALVEIARNGREALAALEKSLGDPDGRIDLVLMDIMMPEMDGLTATREIRKRSEWKKLPIIALTAKAMKDDHQQCLEAGANDYMAKPLDVDRLLSLVRVWLAR